MEFIAKNETLAVRRMEENERDVELMLRWMTDPETMRYWEGMTVHFDRERVLRDFYRHIDANVTPCILMKDGRDIGYLQFEKISSAEDYEMPEAEWARVVKPDEMVYGIDLFIGEVGERDRGVGTRIMNLTAETLFETYGADVLLIDPKAHNLRAIACYRKAGFEDLCLVPQREEQDGVLHDSLILYRRK